MLSAGKMDAVIQVLPPALRFWDKLGLGPRGGPKSIAGYVLFEERDEDRRNQVKEWLERVSATYIVRFFPLKWWAVLSNNSPTGKGIRFALPRHLLRQRWSHTFAV